MSEQPLLEIKNLSVVFEVGRRQLRAVDDVSLTIHAGECLGLVGESGCGKTTVGRAAAGILPPASGQILYRGADWAKASKAQRREIARKRQMVFQDPMASMDPLWKVGDIIAEPLKAHGMGKEAEKKVPSLMSRVGLESTLALRFPQELSGGQRQRAAIARALSTDPELLIMDEPTASLDVSVRAQALNLLADLQAERNLAILLITHDISVVTTLAQRIAVMYMGRIVEIGPASEVLKAPSHPYTKMLLASVLPPKPTGKLPPIPPGETPDPFSLPQGCRYRSRCSLAIDRCEIEEPLLNAWQVGAREAACWRASPGQPG